MAIHSSRYDRYRLSLASERNEQDTTAGVNQSETPARNIMLLMLTVLLLSYFIFVSSVVAIVSSFSINGGTVECMEAYNVLRAKKAKVGHFTFLRALSLSI